MQIQSPCDERLHFALCPWYNMSSLLPEPCKVSLTLILVS